MEWIFYLIGLLDSLKWVLVAICIIIGFLTLFYLIDYLSGDDNQYTKFKNYLICMIISLFFAIAIPTKETMYTMVGIHLTEEVIISESAQKIKDGTLETIILYLNKVTDELKNEDSNTRTSD